MLNLNEQSDLRDLAQKMDVQQLKAALQLPNGPQVLAALFGDEPENLAQMRAWPPCNLDRAGWMEEILKNPSRDESAVPREWLEASSLDSLWSKDGPSDVSPG